MEWLETLGPWATLVKIGLILLLAVIARVVIGFSIRRSVKAILSGGKGAKVSGLSQERIAQRGKTIGSVLDNLATWTITLTALVMTISELGVNVGALIAVSTIVGAALGFGAQTLVKDVISGIFIVFEDQYGVGDQVTLSGVTGVVERVRLRVTEVRDADGMLWFIRNGEILNVGNASHARSV
jgi:moderate conductance mechanosensitive channel